MSIDTLLHEEIQNELGELKKIQVGTDQYKVTVDGLTKLMDRAIEMKKSDIEAEERAESREIETNLKIKQMEDEQKDRKLKNCISIAGIVIPTAVTIWGTIKSIKFEQEGTITTIMGRGFIQKLLPKK